MTKQEEDIPVEEHDDKIDFNAQVGEALAAADAEDAKDHEPAAGDEDIFTTGEIPRT